MANWDDVRRVVAELPEVSESAGRDGLAWRARTALFAWERPLRKKDLDELGDAAPTADVLAVSVPDLAAKEALLSADFCFTTTHFDGYPAVLVHLDRVPQEELRELLVEAWLARAPKTLVRRFTQLD